MTQGQIGQREVDDRESPEHRMPDRRTVRKSVRILLAENLLLSVGIRPGLSPHKPRCSRRLPGSSTIVRPEKELGVGQKVSTPPCLQVGQPTGRQTFCRMRRETQPPLVLMAASQDSPLSVSKTVSGSPARIATWLMPGSAESFANAGAELPRSTQRTSTTHPHRADLLAGAAIPFPDPVT